MAHELGHNMSLGHAPCGDAGGLDPFFPSTTAAIGIWGYDIDADRLIPATHKDLMSYCNPQWISDYNFAKALRYRLFDERPGVDAVPGPSLLLWGGVGADGAPLLEPAFLWMLPPGCPTRVANIGSSASPATTRNSSYSTSQCPAFVLPVQPGWTGDLASITLTGPGGSVTLDADTDLPMTILRNLRNG